MRLRVFSDLHLEFGPFVPPAVEADVVVLAGDTHLGTKGVAWARQAFADVPVIYVLGNHEYYGHAIPRLVDQLRHEAAGSNVHVLERDVLTIEGVRFAGATLWTDMALGGDLRLGMDAAGAHMSDFRMIRVSPRYRRLEPADAVGFHQRTRAWLEEVLTEPPRVHVVVTHHAPLPASLDPAHAGAPARAAYASNLRALIERTQPSLWVHGHVHHARDHHVGATRILCNPRGYPRERYEGFRPDLVVEVPSL
ncbi:MAG: metallophosphoesterase [Myxococcales bacterium]|nr:metallophosphoesterase [Myxococcales bacterium]